MKTLRQRLTQSRINVATFEQEKTTKLIKERAPIEDIKRQLAISSRAVKNMI